ncbi:Acyl-CoA N-acyltransferases superfamily protein [Prunus dulcis]|uniref:Acyl-CoA N-acyltransferases superfamily protein n=1 Tax=Prunus dulcis TaxID=3755 RepID=A0A4Y1R3Z6_PRUDU|nr:Acyl-CoA N-acyltransferases superfamily protein [Prunus dulcis]
MVDSNPSSGSPEDTPNPNPDGNAPSENDLTLDSLSRKVQESLSVGKKHKFWETQPVGQFKDLGTTVCLKVQLRTQHRYLKSNRNRTNFPTSMNGPHVI